MSGMRPLETVQWERIIRIGKVDTRGKLEADICSHWSIGSGERRFLFAMTTLVSFAEIVAAGCTQIT